MNADVGQSPQQFPAEPIGASDPMLNKTQLDTHRQLGIPDDYALGQRLPYFFDATELVDIGPNLVGRMQRLTPEAASRWQAMLSAARSEGVTLLIVSGFRSFDYQTELIRKKLVAGQAIGDILQVNAAPGYSQHHTGAAVDIATPGSRPLTEEFENSEAFAWLGRRAAEFGFSMTYPRGNRYGFVFEPWHWALN
jgi:D-alanyl-D-alanine carboxypeptidase